VADLATGAEVEVPQGALATTLTLGAEGILDAAGLPAPVPLGKSLLGAAVFTPDGQAVAPPHATIYIPTVLPAALALAPAEVFPLYFYDGVGWSLAGVSGTTGTNPSHPDQTVVVAVVGTLRTYAVFLNDADADGVRDETDNCPTVPNPSQLDTDGDQIGDACECVSVSCNDGNGCTDDGCDPTTGCVYANNTSACEDGNPCTVGDACSGGTCQSGSAITPPPEAQGFAAEPDKVGFTWGVASGATEYEVVRGSLDALGVGPGGGDEVCFGGLFDASVIDYQTPPSGEGFWYLARGRNVCGTGTYGQQSNGTPRITGTCP
jgi:hypothetical protein